MKKLLYLLVMVAIFGFSSCGDDDDDITFADIAVNFASTELGIDEENTSADVTVNLSRTADVNIDVTVKFTPTDVVYGTDFTTEPASTDNTAKITIPAGSTSASFKVKKAENVLFDGDESIKFNISAISVTNGVVIGEKKDMTLNFKAIISEGQTMILEGKTAESNYANSVYVDFSTNTQYAVDRTSWSLGFYSGKDFHVILSTGNSVSATSSGKTDINAVTLADATTCPINISATGMMDPLVKEAIDNIDGTLEGSVFGEVSATETENMVYFVSDGGEKGADRSLWYKVKVNRKGEGYTVQYARVGDTDIQTIDIEKDAAYNLVGFNLATKEVVKEEPQAAKWDIMWGYNTGLTIMSGNNEVYGYMQDNVLSNNLGGTEVAEIAVTATMTYDSFKKADLDGLTFSKDRSTIGTNWRNTAGGMEGGATGINYNKFYIVKDAAGNYYKLKFSKMGLGSDKGERGRPEIAYALIK
ncbi:HmuY family protein [Prevotella sp. 10(H)]|uniref:HmuY family protein n=1 Tax=Prevotella sp. 10(H) TaxID=1158294 RepID=UPI0004A6C62B|nr:HmuY family protein [Prevotella sp. 10(H)]